MHHKPLIETQYFPAVGFFYFAANAGGLHIEACENYQKGSLRNRCIINGPQRIQQLSVPLLKGKHQQMPVRDVRISYDEDWPMQHWRSLKTAYGSAPFFVHYEDIIRPLIMRKPRYLWDLNWLIIETMNELLGINAELKTTTNYVFNARTGQPDLRSTIGPRKANTDFLGNLGTQIPVYNPLFQGRKLPSPLLSSLELLFYAGPESAAVLSDDQYPTLLKSISS